MPAEDVVMQVIVEHSARKGKGSTRASAWCSRELLQGENSHSIGRDYCSNLRAGVPYVTNECDESSSGGTVTAGRRLLRTNYR